MKKKIVWLIVSSLMAISLVLASCAGEEEEEEEVTVPTEEEEVVIPTEEEEVAPPPGEGNWWDYLGEPQYGGTFTFSGGDVFTWDPYWGWDFSGTAFLYFENMACSDWTLDREIFGFDSGWIPSEYVMPLLAESWEQENPNTQVFHIRQGVYWHNKYPANGREMTAYDVSWSLNRLYGCGDGFTQQSPHLMFPFFQIYEKIYARDKYTLVIEYDNPVDTFDIILGQFHNQIMCPDMVEEYGDLLDWHAACGTGPFVVEDYVVASSITFTKNQNYWGYDERHPENRIPYVDKLKILIIPEPTVAYAALRTGKIDRVGGVDWEQAEQLIKTNPDLQYTTATGMQNGLRPRVDLEPFSDIRVRKALNMAIDRKLIAQTIRGGYVDGVTVAQMGPAMGPYFTPFEEWPKELQEEYTYNPERAKALLAEAGYPNGFKTNVVAAGTPDDILVFKEMLMNIGVDMEIRVMESSTLFSFTNVHHKHDAFAWQDCGSWTMAPWPGLSIFTTGYMYNSGMVSDEVFDDMNTSIMEDEEGNRRTDEEIAERTKACDMYIMSHHWMVPSVPSVYFTFWQPWLKGYSGEETYHWMGTYYARWWIDHDVKKAMGY